MDVLELIDETFDKDRTETYELSIQVSLNGFSFAVKDTIRNTFIVLISKPFSGAVITHDNWYPVIEGIVKEFPFLNQKFKKVFFSYTLSPFTIVPKDFFDIQRIKDLFELTHPLPEHFELRYTSISNGENLVILFAMPYTMSSAWLKIQPNTIFLTQPSSLFVGFSKSKYENYVQVYFEETRMTIVYHKNEKLIAANAFTYMHTNDALYYILSFCNSITDNFSSIQLSIVGESFNNNELVKGLNKSFSNVSIDPIFNSVHFSYRLLRQRNRHYALFNSFAVCE